MPDQPSPTPGRQDVTAALLALIEARRARGIETYGAPLMTENGRDATQDLVEELVDAAHYCLQWQLERRGLLAENERLRAGLIRLTDYPEGHRSSCMWDEEADCDCGFEEAWSAAWKALRGEP